MQILWKSFIPIETVSPNKSEHWTKRFKRNKSIKNWIWYKWQVDKPKIALPCTVRLSRIAPRLLDSHDNLPMSQKYVVDVIADLLIPGLESGQADSDKRLSFEYGQKKPEKGQKLGVEITVYQA